MVTDSIKSRTFFLSPRPAIYCKCCLLLIRNTACSRYVSLKRHFEETYDSSVTINLDLKESLPRHFVALVLNGSSSSYYYFEVIKLICSRIITRAIYP